MSDLWCCVRLCLVILVSTPLSALAGDQPEAALSDYFPPHGGARGLANVAPSRG